MRIVVGCDHGGFPLKQELLKHLAERGISVQDVGCFSTESVDYPDIAEKATDVITAGEADRGILICGTGIGMSIAANKVPGIRAALGSDPYSARMACEHNDAQVLCLGARVLGPSLAMEIVDAYLDAVHAGGRHATRVEKMMQIEKKYREGGKHPCQES